MFRKKRDPKPTRGSVQLRDPPAARDRRLAQRLDPDADADGTAPPHKQKPHPLTLPDNLPPLPLARASLLRKTMLDADLERRLSDALRHLLASPELPWTPFPSLIRQLRRDEARLAMQRGKPTVEEAGRLVWSTGRRVRSALDQRLVTYTPRGSAWLSLVPLLDRSAVDRVAGQLATSNLLASFSTTQATPRGELTLRTTTCIRGEQLFAPRLIPYASTFDLAEHVHVDGPAGMLGEAISLFEQRLVDTALMINDSDEQLFELVEVPQPRQGGGGGDGEDAAREDVPEAQFESKADDTAHFELGELRQKPLSSKLRKAILAAVLHGLPVYLRLLVLVPVFEDTTAVADTSTAGASADGDARGGGSSAPRWEYARLRKAFFLSFSPIGRVAAFAPSAMGGESLPERCAPPKEALLYTCSWTSEREAASYLATVQQRLASGMEESRRQYAKFAFDDLANLLARTNYNALLIQLVLLLPHFKNEIESRSILGELYLYFRSDAAVVEEIADALAAVRLALDCCADGRVSKAKRARVLSVVSRQFIHHSRLLLRIVQSDEWTDAAALAAPLGALVQSVGDDLGGLAEGDGKHGAIVADERYARMLHAERADAVVSNCKRVVEIVSNAWKENEGAAIPVSLAPRARRERVIDVENECRRHAKLGTYSADSLRESVLLQYVVDTGVDASIRRALTTTCEAPVILPNPFSTALRVLKEAASEFEVHRAPDSVVAAAWAAHAGPCELELEPSLRVYAAPTPPPPLPPTTAAMASPIVDRLGEILNADEPTGHSAAVAASVYGGPAQVTYADRVGLHALRAEIGDELMAVRMRSVVHGFETHYFCCYDDVASAMDRAPAGTRYAARIREDHFVRAGSLSEAVLVHCHRVLAVILRLHRDTMHLVGTIQLGDARWTIGDVLFDQRLAFGEMTNAVNAGGSLSIEVSVHVIDPTAGDEAAKGERARQRRTEGPAHPLPRAPNRYVAVSKQFHLVALTQGGERGYQQLVTCIPRRSGTFHRSVFLSRVHALAAGAVEQHSERRGAVAGGARERVRLEGCTALRSGDALGACRCFLRLRAIDRDRFDKETRARCARLLSCAAANLESFRRLSMAIRHALRACEVDESLNKSYSTTLAAMIDTLRSHVCGYLDADECCDFQLVRFDVQAAFYAIFKRVRTHGALSPSLVPHLELVEHYVHGVELAIGHRVMLASGELGDGLDVAFEFSGKKPAVPGRRASESTHK